MDELLAKGMIRESLNSCAIPTLLAPMRDWSIRVCVDSRAVNKITIKHRHSIPRLEDLFVKLYGVVVFSNIALKSGYY